MSSEDFHFDVSAKIRRVTDNEILESLRNFCVERSDKLLTTEEYDKWPDRAASTSTIIKRFGSWRDALGRVGGIAKAREYSAKELMDNLERIWIELRYPPGKRKLSQLGAKISERPYIRLWGSLKNACTLLAQYKNGKMSEEQLINQPEPTNKRTTIPLSIRWKVLKQDNYRCVKCGKRPPDVELEIDHILPVSRGGTNEPSNLQTLCDVCNGGKSNHYSTIGR